MFSGGINRDQKHEMGLSDTSLNQPGELNHWALRIFSTWNQGEKWCILFT